MFGKKKRTHATADMSEQAMNDSLRAAQVIFQRHAGSQSSLNSTSNPSLANPNVSRYRVSSNSIPTSRSTSQPGSWRSPSAASKSSQQNINRSKSPTPSESAHAAAALAHMSLGRESDHQHNELLGLSSLPNFQVQSLSAGPSTRGSDSKIEHMRRENVLKVSIPSKQPNVSRSQLSLDIRPVAQSQRPSPVKTPASSPNIGSTMNSQQPKIARSESRTLVGRVPPPNIYLQDPDGQVISSSEAGEDGRSLNLASSSSSAATSSSGLSFVTGGSSYVGDDTVDSVDEEYGTYVGDSQDEYELRESSPLQGAHDRETQFTSSTVDLSSNTSELETPTSPVQTNATYGKLNKIGNGNVTFQGTLPDLIPNHTRRTRMEKFKTKLFGSKNRSELHGEQLPTSSVTADGEGRPVVTTNNNLRFKTTMRGHDRHSSSETGKGSLADSQQGGVGADEDMLDSDEDDSDSSKDPADGKRHKKRAGLRRRLRHTAAVVPYPHHLHHHEHRHGQKRKGFNEDKPWKSHKDVGFVTAQERKRYEGMWVTNRCLYLELLPWWGSVISGQRAPPVKLPEDGLVLNLVVKDIWQRSNLPNGLLMQIYEKVDTRQDGTLDRKSFIVGMWLVDQCLYGRKLPKDIDQQVWDSVDRYVVNVINSTTMKQMDRSKKKQLKQEIKNIKKDMKNVSS